jgi:hypothetical protein
MEWTFGSVLWPMAALTAWTIAVLLFCYTLIDITRRAYSGWVRAAWIATFVIMPIVGPLAYVALTALRRRREEYSELRRIELDGPSRWRSGDGHMTPAQVAVLKRQSLRY